MALTLDACVAQHQGDRKEQQDRVGLMAHPRLKGTVLAVLADGMGGHTGGALAAEQVVHTAQNNFSSYAPKDEAADDLLRTAIHEAHLLIRTSRFLNEKDPHSTAVMLVLEPGGATWAHCGDSRLYHYRGDRLLQHSADHSYVEHLVRAGKITPEQALIHPNRNVLLTSLGDKDDPKIDVGQAEVQPGDNFLLCSDGLWAYFSDAEIGGVLAAFPAREAAEILINRARQRCQGEGDNCSLAILRLLP